MPTTGCKKYNPLERGMAMQEGDAYHYCLRDRKIAADLTGHNLMPIAITRGMAVSCTLASPSLSQRIETVPRPGGVMGTTFCGTRRAADKAGEA
jgi:hypothetical protein